MKQMQSRVKILGVGVDKIEMEEALELVLGWLREKNGAKHYIVTPNLEFLLAAARDNEFKKVLNEADLALPDSARLGIVKKIQEEGNTIKRLMLLPCLFLPFLIPFDRFPKTTGIDFMENLCLKASDLGFTVGFLGGRKKVAEKAAECLKKRYPKLKITIAEDGPEVDMEGNQVLREKAEKNFHIPNTDLLFVAFGQVKQEKWMAKNLPHLPVKVTMGVGGSFDYLSGVVPRAPFWMKNLGFEWLFRLMIQPWRIKRQLALLKIIRHLQMAP